MADDLKDAIKQNVEGPKQASAAGVNVQQHPLDDQIAADKQMADKRAVAGLFVLGREFRGRPRGDQVHLPGGQVGQLDPSPAVSPAGKVLASPL